MVGTICAFCFERRYVRVFCRHLLADVFDLVEFSFVVVLAGTSQTVDEFGRSAGRVVVQRHVQPTNPPPENGAETHDDDRKNTTTTTTVVVTKVSRFSRPLSVARDRETTTSNGRKRFRASVHEKVSESFSDHAYQERRDDFVLSFVTAAAAETRDQRQNDGPHAIGRPPPPAHTEHVIYQFVLLLLLFIALRYTKTLSFVSFYNTRAL